MEDFIKSIFDALMSFLQPHEPWLRVVSYIVSPILAGLAFWANLRARLKMQYQSQRLGMLKRKSTEDRETLGKLRAQVQRENDEVLKRGNRIRELESDLERITQGNQSLWKLRPSVAFPKYKEWSLTREGAKVVTFGNLKGGVGKTTLAANFAAYLSRTCKKQVLLIDLDYQGSLSNGLMLAAGQFEVESRAQWLLQDNADLITLERAKVHLTPAIDRAWLVPASYSLAEAESRLLMQWLLPYTGPPQVDVCYRLAHALLRPEVRRSYDVIIIDMPPRLSIGGVNALVASHFFVVPTILDKLSIEAIPQFLRQMQGIKNDLNLDLDFAGVVATMTRNQNISATEAEMLGHVRTAGRDWDPNRDFIIKQHLPKRAAIARVAGEGVAYNLTGADDVREFFDPIFAELLTRIGIKPSTGVQPQSEA